MSETIKAFLCFLGVAACLAIFYYAQEVRQYRYLEHEAAMEKIRECSP